MSTEPDEGQPTPEFDREVPGIGGSRRPRRLDGAIESALVEPVGRLVERAVPDGLTRATPVLDEFNAQLERTRQLLAGDIDEAAERALAKLGINDQVEQRIAAQMAATGPLASPERFPEAHRLVVRGLEVLDREGSRDPRVPSLGPVSVVAAFLLETVASYIVKAYAQDVVNQMRKLYTRRESQSAAGTPERLMLARARLEMDRLTTGFSGGGLGIFALVFGGVLVPVIASVGKSLVRVPLSDKPVLLGGFAALFVLSLLISWILLQGAAIAHRRSALIMKQPLEALWETIGHCGDAPEDDSVLYATYAVILTALVWLVLPALAALVYFLL